MTWLMFSLGHKAWYKEMIVYQVDKGWILMAYFLVVNLTPSGIN